MASLLLGSLVSDHDFDMLWSSLGDILYEVFSLACTRHRCCDRLSVVDPRHQFEPGGPGQSIEELLPETEPLRHVVLIVLVHADWVHRVNAGQSARVEESHGPGPRSLASTAPFAIPETVMGISSRD